MEGNEEDENLEKLPNLFSSDPNERKLARQLRIQRRLEALKKQQMEAEHGDVEDEEVKNTVQQQILKSYELMEKYIQNSEEYITNVRMINDAREVSRREREGLSNEKIIQRLEEEAEDAKTKFDEIAAKWSDIMEYKDPMDIRDAIQEQKEAGDVLIAQKDEFIEMLKSQLRNAEQDFMLDQRKQNEDISTLAKRIETQVIFMRKMYNQELMHVVQALDAERKRLREEAQKRWDALYEERDAQELKTYEDKEASLERFHEQTNLLRIDFQEIYRATKIRIEREIEELQKQLESIKALTLLNNEKLDYNYQILKKREDENIKIKSQQKRRINKLRDVVIALRKKNHEYEENSLNMIKKLEDEIKKLNVCILEVESKADHFAIINDKKFHMVLEMNKKEAEKVLRRIQEVDKILHAQQMGEEWQPFEVNLRFVYYDKLRNRRDSSAKLTTQTKDQDDESLTSAVLSTEALSTKKTASMMLDWKQTTDSSQYCSLVKKILYKVADHTGFLTEEKLMKVLEPYIDVQKCIVGLDTTFEALGVNNKDDIDLLVQCFLPYTYCVICQEDEKKLESEQFLDDSTSFYSQESFHKLPNIQDMMGQEEFNESAITNAIWEPDQTYTEFVLDNVEEGELEDLSEFQEVMEKNSLYSVHTETTAIQSTKSARFKEMKPQDSMKNPAQMNVLECAMKHPLSISPVHVLTALKKFVEAFYSGNNQIIKLTMQDRLSNKRETISRQIPSIEIKKFWARYKNAFPQEKQALWSALLAGLKKYHEILKKRKMLSVEVVQLRQQNKELKQILANYIHHGKAMAPPCGEDSTKKTRTRKKCVYKVVKE